MAEKSDDLMKELNGELPPLAPGEVAPTPAPSRDEQLTVPGPIKPSAARAADAVHSTRSGGSGWRVKVKGDYFAQSPEGRGKVKKDYEAEFNLPNLDAALSVIKNKLLAPTLRKKYADFVRARTCRIIDALPMSPNTPATRNLQYMNREQLMEHVAAVRAPIDPEAYVDVTDLRDAVIDFTQTPKGFEDREARRQKDRAETAALAALNPDITVGQ